MHVIFVEPAFPKNQAEFVRALVEVGARVSAIGEAPEAALGELRGHLAGYEQVASVTHEESLETAVRRIQSREWVDRLEATVEAHIMPVAHVRERTEIPGTTTRTAFLCRDKPAMKEALRQADVPCAQSMGAESLEEAIEFAKEVGYPIILKPREGAGASGTYRVENQEELEAAAKDCKLDLGMPTALEEFIEGHEGFYDTLTVDGTVIHDFVCHYYPNVLEAMRTRWISPQIVLTNQSDGENYDEVREMGAKVIKDLDIGTSATHMEWFFGPKGLKFSEIGCRPPGVRVWDFYGAANDLDIYTEWAKAVVHGKSDSKASRKYSAGMVALRPERDGTISGYEGVEQVQRMYGEWILDAHFPPPGTPTQPVEAGYMANAYMRLRHPDFDQLRAMLDKIGETVKVLAR